MTKWHPSIQCPKCGNKNIEKTEIDETEDGSEIYEFRCLKCGYKWQEES